MKKEIENTYGFRYFLIVSQLSNGILQLKPQNFAKLFIELGQGRYGVEQMTVIFDKINNTLAQMTYNDDSMVFDENDFEELSQLSIDELDYYYDKYILDENNTILKI